jgi:hypothetical protein
MPAPAPIRAAAPKSRHPNAIQLPFSRAALLRKRRPPPRRLAPPAAPPGSIRAAPWRREWRPAPREPAQHLIQKGFP